LEIPRCESCGKIAQYKVLAIDGNYVCCECARFVSKENNVKKPYVSHENDNLPAKFSICENLPNEK
jgi:lysyl-tRNA synthetase class I